MVFSPPVKFWGVQKRAQKWTLFSQKTRDRKLNTEGYGMAEIGWGVTISPMTEGFRMGVTIPPMGGGFLGEKTEYRGIRDG